MKYSYNYLKKNLKAGDCILFHRKGIISWAIRTVTQSHWSHVAMYTRDSSYIESDWFGVEEEHLYSLEDQDILIVQRKGLTAAERKTIIKLAKSYRKQPYDYKQIWQLFLMLIKGERGRPEPVGSAHKFICAEVPALIYETIGKPIVKGLHYSQVIPSDWLNKKDWSLLEGDL